MTAAGIVTYEPEIERLAQNVVAVASQVRQVIIYDNGSSNVSEIAELARHHANVELMQSSTNDGIAFALNRLSTRAVEIGAKWLVTLDQDSVSAPGMVEEMRAVARDGIPVVTPYIVDRNKLSVDDYRQMKLPRVEFYRHAAWRGAITSGALVSLDVWAEVGGYDDRFFIDYVDYDFNQCVLLAGHRIARANGTYLLHEVGKAEKTWLFVPRRDLAGRWRLERFYAFGHSANRCYYKARNRVLFTRKYGRRIGFTHEGIWQIPQQVALTVMFEPDRGAKFRAFCRGVRDGLRMNLT